MAADASLLNRLGNTFSFGIFMWLIVSVVLNFNQNDQLLTVKPKNAKLICQPYKSIICDKAQTIWKQSPNPLLTTMRNIHHKCVTIPSRPGDSHPPPHTWHTSRHPCWTLGP